MAEINDLNVTDAQNTARFPEQQTPSSLNDGSRALEGILARWNKDTNGSLVTTGSANAYVLTPTRTIPAYYDGLVFSFEANHANTGAITLNVTDPTNTTSLGAKDVKKFNDQDLASGDIEAGQKVSVIYDGTNFQMVSLPASILPGAGTITNAMLAANAVTVSKLASDANTYDIAFNAGFASDGTAEDIVVQSYAEMVMARSGSITGEGGYIDTAGTGTAVIVDVEKNGATIYTTKPQFAASANALTAGALKSDGTEDFVAGDRISFKVTQIGSTTAGAGVRFTLKGQLS